MDMDWENISSIDLVNYIEKEHNKYLEGIMPELSRLTTLILKVHESEHRELSMVHRLYHIIQVDLIQQIFKEQIGIFPLIKMYTKKPSKELLDEMLETVENILPLIDETKELLNELNNITDGYTAPEDGCVTYDNTYEKLAEFESNILKKISLEEDVLFPRLKEELDRY